MEIKEKLIELFDTLHKEVSLHNKTKKIYVKIPKYISLLNYYEELMTALDEWHASRNTKDVQITVQIKQVKLDSCMFVTMEQIYSNYDWY